MKFALADYENRIAKIVADQHADIINELGYASRRVARAASLWLERRETDEAKIAFVMFSQTARVIDERLAFHQAALDRINADLSKPLVPEADTAPSDDSFLPPAA